MNIVNRLNIVESIYKLYKNKNHISASKLKITGGVPFVGVGVGMGQFFGILYITSNVTYKKVESNKEFNISPFILFCQTLTQGRAMFENLKKEKVRFNRLAGEIQKQKYIDEEKNKNLSNETEFNSNQVNTTVSKSVERGKRLSLNNGIFKPNDNY